MIFLKKIADIEINLKRCLTSSIPKSCRCLGCEHLDFTSFTFFFKISSHND